MKNHARIIQESLEPVGFMLKDYKERWDSKQMNSLMKDVPNGQWVDLQTGGDDDAMVIVGDQNGIDKAEEFSSESDFCMFLSLGYKHYWDTSAKDFVIKVEDMTGAEIEIYWDGGAGGDKATMAVFGESKKQQRIKENKKALIRLPGKLPLIKNGVHESRRRKINEGSAEDSIDKVDKKVIEDILDIFNRNTGVDDLSTWLDLGVKLGIMDIEEAKKMWLSLI